MSNRPGGALATRPLQFIWIVDCSGSMQGKKIESLNFAIREAIPAMQEVARENPNAQVLMRAVRFSDGARWHVAQATEVQRLQMARSYRRWRDRSRQGARSGRGGYAHRTHAHARLAAGAGADFRWPADRQLCEGAGAT